MNWLTIFMKYFPAVLAGVIAVQTAIGSAPGATKKTVVLDSIVAAAKVGETVDEAHVSGISTLIDTVVATLKATNTAGFSMTPAGASVKPAIAK